MAEDGAGAEGSSMPPPDPAPLLMDDALHRLRILNYETGYCAKRGAQPFHSLQFAAAAPGSGSQWGTFASICGWLVTQCGRPWTVDKFEDPNSVLTKLLNEARALGAGPEIVDAPPVKLRAAIGEAPCRLLLFLCDAALRSKGFRWEKPRYPEEPAPEAVEEEGGDAAADEDGIADNVDDDALDGDDEEEVLFSMPTAAGAGAAAGGGTPRPGGTASPVPGGVSGAAPAATVMESTIDPASWRAELERVAPRLKPPVPGAGSHAAVVVGGAGPLSIGGRGGAGGGVGAAIRGEWRGHLEATKSTAQTVGSELPPTVGTLDRLGSELVELLDVVSQRERYLSSAYKALAAEHKEQEDKRAQITAALATAQGRVAGLTSELAAVGEALEEVRAAAEERGSAVSDASPLIKIKAALSSLRAETRSLDLQLGVLGHAVMQQRLAARQQANDAIAAEKGGARGKSGSGPAPFGLHPAGSGLRSPGSELEASTEFR